LDGSGTKTRKYLCTQLKYSKFEDNPTSVSIFVEKNGENAARFRISLEIENDGLDKATMDKYHSHLDVPLNKEAGLVYVSGSNKWGNPIVMDKPQDEIKKDVTECKIRKVQVSRYVERKPDETNEYYHMEISKAISAIIPYYDYVLGIETREEALEVMFDKNMILYGPPGTGKTYNTAIYAVAICDGKSIDELTNYKEVMARYNELKSKNRIIFTTFHQSYGYEEFIEGIKPIVDSDNNEIGYTIESGIFKKFCENARKSEEIDGVPYVFIIDEINRGNISKIFGELITLIEDTKRDGMPEAVSAILPYSGKTFSIPSNVYILGTMNTADRSIALMDTALRRRFQFVEMMPNSDVIRKIHADKVIVGNDVLDVAAMLDTINERITFLYDREHTIGHSFFIGLATNPSIDNLAGIFSKSIIPLLQEYFYEDYQKIQLVLGDNSKTEESHKFIRDTKVVAKNIFKGSMDDIVDLPEKKYEINYEAFTNILSYIEIM
jgi:5-methylcytosine-specific restriction endonuclease McrBC GTP-binding regulatory subunit McrB